MDDLGVIPLAQEAEVLKVLLKQVRSLRGYETVLSDQSSGSDQRLSSMQELAASAVDWIKRYNRVTSSVLELTCLVRSVAVALLRRKYPDLRLGSLKPGPSSNKFRREFSAITFAVFKGIGGGSFPKAEQRAFVSQCYKWEISTFPALAASFGVCESLELLLARWAAAACLGMATALAWPHIARTPLPSLDATEFCSD